MTIAKVRSLLALSRSPNEHEARAAFSKAVELFEKLVPGGEGTYAQGVTEERAASVAFVEMLASTAIERTGLVVGVPAKALLKKLARSLRAGKHREIC